MAVYSPNSGDSFRDQDANNIAELYSAEVEIYEQSADFFLPMEGPSASSPIQVKTDLNKGRGQKIHFRVKSGFYYEPLLADEEPVAGSYEPMLSETYPLELEWYRHMTSYTERAEELMGIRGEFMSGIPAEQGKWLGRLKTERLLMMFRERGGAANLTYAGDATSVDTLAANDTLNHDVIVENGNKLKQMSGQPASIGYKGKEPIKKYCVVATTEALNSLELDSDYLRNVREAGVRGEANYIFEGGFPMLRGHAIKEYTSINHDGEGPLGSPLVANAEIGVAMTNADVGEFITGGGYAAAATNTSAKYYRSFPNYAYPYTEQITLAADGGATFYVAILNHTGADAGKFGFYSYNVNDGSQLTIVDALTSGDTTLGGLTWDASVNTSTHPEGSQVILVNENCVPYGYTVMMGASAAYRGYGKYQRKRSTDEQHGGHKQEVYCTSIFGQDPRQDRRGNCPGFLTVCHALQIPGVTLNPTLT